MMTDNPPASDTKRELINKILPLAAYLQANTNVDVLQNMLGSIPKDLIDMLDTKTLEALHAWLKQEHDRLHAINTAADRS